MINATDPISKKLTVIITLLVAITGLIAAWVSFIKVMNPEPVIEKKAERAYQVLKEKIEFQDMVIRDTRDQLKDLEMKLWFSAYMDRQMALTTDTPGVMAEESITELRQQQTLSVEDTDTPPRSDLIQSAITERKKEDVLLQKSKKLPRSL